MMRAGAVVLESNRICQRATEARYEDAPLSELYPTEHPNTTYRTKVFNQLGNHKVVTLPKMTNHDWPLPIAHEGIEPYFHSLKGCCPRPVDE